jgi:hypothetical protein
MLSKTARILQRSSFLSKSIRPFSTIRDQALANKQTKLFINGEFVNSVSGQTFGTIDPSNEEVVAQVQKADHRDVELAV